MIKHEYFTDPSSPLSPRNFISEPRPERLADYGDKFYRVVGVPTSPMEPPRDLIFTGIDPNQDAGATEQIHDALRKDFGIDVAQVKDIHVLIAFRDEVNKLRRLPVSKETSNGLHVAEQSPRRSQPKRVYNLGRHILGQYLFS